MPVAEVIWSSGTKMMPNGSDEPAMVALFGPVTEMVAEMFATPVLSDAATVTNGKLGGMVVLFSDKVRTVSPNTINRDADVAGAGPGNADRLNVALAPPLMDARTLSTFFPSVLPSIYRLALCPLAADVVLEKRS